MVCFSGIGGTMRVGWRLTRVARRELNSEYRRRTSRSFCLLEINHTKGSAFPSTYSRSDGIYNKTPTAFVILACMRDKNWQLGVLVEDLFDPTLIYTLSPRIALI